MSQPAAPVRVPLAVDARLRLPLGSLALPLRSAALAAAAGPPALLVLNLRLPGLWSPVLACFLLAATASSGIPEREGVWVGTHALYRQGWRLLPSMVEAGRAGRARISRDGPSIRVKPLPPGAARILLRRTAGGPVDCGSGVVDLPALGHRVVLAVEGPAVACGSEAHVRWCQRLMDWLRGLDCPAQVLTTLTHHDSSTLGAAYEHRVRGWPATPLRDLERRVVEGLAERTVALHHHIVLSPGLCGPDGLPPTARPLRLPRTPRADHHQAASCLALALRTASAHGLSVQPVDGDELAALLRRSILGGGNALAGGGLLRLGEHHQVVLTVLQLPAVLSAGAALDAVIRARCAGLISLHLLPVAPANARRELHRREASLRYATRRGADPVASEMALQETTEVLAGLAERTLTPLRIALSVAVEHAEAPVAEAAAERVAAGLSAAGLRVTTVTVPGLFPLYAVAPGCWPCGRSVILTTDTVAQRLIPCLGTPFSDAGEPLAGVNLLTGSPAHISVFRRANHNLVVLGSSGAGKSVTAKTLLARHVMEGAAALIIDPDSEYRPLTAALGGDYVELGDDALNPMAVTAGVAPDAGASLALPILSVMAGDEKGLRQGRPIRRLADEDQGWLHGELVELLRERGGHRQPLLGEVVEHLDAVVRRALSEREKERCRVIAARLRRYTQGERAAVFNRPSTVALDGRVTAVGLRRVAMTYGADLTVALAIVLSTVLASLRERRQRLIVVVDEAHRVTVDPDAGEVLAQLVRQARKHGAGVWMLSQQVEDFVGTDLGRTLAATAASRVVLATEEAVLPAVREVFGLQGHEVAAISPGRPGRGLLLAGGERAVIDVVPGPALLAISDTRAAAAGTG